MRARGMLAAVAVAVCSLGWLDPYHSAREASRLYDAGKYDDAIGKYNEALVDHPDSPLLHFNLGDATYKQGKYTDAVNAFQQVPAGDDDPARSARVAYNLGNAKYRLGEAAEGSDPKAALGLYAEALVAYRRAMGAAPDDLDAKFNHEFVEKKIADLKKKLEEQQKQQDQQQQQKDQQGQQDQQGEQKQQDQQGQQDQQKQQPEGEKKQQAGSEQQQAAGASEGGAAEKKDGEMSRQEAAALLDAQRSDEVPPEQITKRLLGAGEAEPAEDW
jgi:Ca-activated chloride channel family protein